MYEVHCMKSGVMTMMRGIVIEMMIEMMMIVMMIMMIVMMITMTMVIMIKWL